MNFEFSTAAKIIFGRGSFNRIGEIASRYGSNFLLVCGGRWMDDAGITSKMEKLLQDAGVSFHYYRGIKREPDPETVERGLDVALKNRCDGVIAVGGGSVIDTGKAISALVTNGGPLIDYLEGVGKGKKLSKDPVPFIAVPTTSGTGSEVTKNAVITSREMKFKKSFRNESLIPDVALVDPELTVTVPPSQTAASGMDALTQLIESYVSKKASPFTDIMALHGIKLAARALKRAYDDGSDIKAREDMAMTSLLSGMCLANSGLGAAHGIAAALGCYFGIPHGLACAILIPHVMEFNLKAALSKFAKIGKTLTGEHLKDDDQAAVAGIEFIKKLNRYMGIPENLKGYSITEKDLPDLARASRGNSMRGNPVEMSDEEIIHFLRKLI